MIDRDDLQAVCRQFQLGVSDEVLDELMLYCDTDRDGLINFLEFSNFLNWKDKMPIVPEQHVVARSQSVSCATTQMWTCFIRSKSNEAILSYGNDGVKTELSCSEE